MLENSSNCTILMFFTFVYLYKAFVIYLIVLMSFFIYYFILSHFSFSQSLLFICWSFYNLFSFIICWLVIVILVVVVIFISTFHLFPILDSDGLFRNALVLLLFCQLFILIFLSFIMKCFINIAFVQFYYNCYKNWYFFILFFGGL